MPRPSTREAVKAAIDKATECELIALVGVLQNPDEKAIGTVFAKHAKALADKIETECGRSTLFD